MERTRQALVETGFEALLSRKPSPNRQYRKLDGVQEAQLVKLACSSPPAGRVRWTMSLLADKLVELKVVEAIGEETVRTTLKKHDQAVAPGTMGSPAGRGCGFRLCDGRCPRGVSPAVRPETAGRRLGRAVETVDPGDADAGPGHGRPAGTANLFMTFEPLGGRRRVTVTDRRTKLDFAEVVRDLIDVQYPTAETIVLVMDNLNTHKMASLYERFPPAEARRLIEKLEVHYTPKHGSWLNMAETELSVLTRQCLDRRIGDKATLVREVAAWEKSRNEIKARVDWQFTTADARVKLKRLYPSIQAG